MNSYTKKAFDCTSRPSEIRLAEGFCYNAGLWCIWICEHNGIIIAQPYAMMEDLSSHRDKVIFSLILPSKVMIDAGLEHDMYFRSLLRNKHFVTLDDIQYRRVTEYFELIHLAIEHSYNAVADDEIRFICLALLKLCRQWYDLREALSDNSRQAQIANEFIQLVSQNCQKERHMPFYADKLAIAPKYLSFVVSSRTGKTAESWIREYSMAKAKDLLLGTNLSINEISDHLNFIATSDFCKWFRRNSGMTPKEFRTQLLSGKP